MKINKAHIEDKMVMVVMMIIMAAGNIAQSNFIHVRLSTSVL